MGEAWKVLWCEIQQDLDTLPVVLDLRAMDLGFEHQALRIYEQVSLSALDLLTAIVTTLLSAYPGRLDRLAIYYACAGLRISLHADPHPFAQGSVHPLPGSIHSPQTEVVVDGLPGWEVMRKQAPGTAAPYDVEDGIEDLAQAMKARSPLVFWSRQVSFDALPLSV
jgi:hypothetical protein